jgi:succinoglycan biosynthesis protein ExoM
MQSNHEIHTTRIAVCIPTRLRAAGLVRVLEGIGKQSLSSHDFATVRVIVVDNDPGASGQNVCDRLRPTYPWPLDYILEPKAGIPYARNRALDAAMPENDLLAFIDDDEVPSEKWLVHLLQVWRDYSADVVFGPVKPYFPDKVPRWIERGAFFERDAHPTGTVGAIGGTGNVLMSTRLLKQSGIRFDENYRFSGGSDYFFFLRVREAGYRMVWAEGADAVEWNPACRANLKWLLMRHFRNGALIGRQHSIWRRFQSSAIGMARIVGGIICALVFLPFGRHRSARALRWASYGLGLLYGVSGNHFEEYRMVSSV